MWGGGRGRGTLAGGKFTACERINNLLNKKMAERFRSFSFHALHELNSLHMTTCPTVALQCEERMQVIRKALIGLEK